MEGYGTRLADANKDGHTPGDLGEVRGVRPSLPLPRHKRVKKPYNNSCTCSEDDHWPPCTGQTSRTNRMNRMRSLYCTDQGGETNLVSPPSDVLGGGSWPEIVQHL